MPTEKVRIRCDQCKNIVAFQPTEAGSTQECPECGSYIDVPDSSTDFYDPIREAERTENQVKEYERQQNLGRQQMEQYQRQLDLGRKQMEQQQRQLDRWEGIAQKKEQEIEKIAATIERWNGLADRIEKLLARREKE